MKKVAKNGITVVEILIIACVVAILAGIVVMVFMNFQETARKTRDAQRIADLTLLGRAINLATTAPVSPEEVKNWTKIDSKTSVKEFGKGAGSGLDISPYLSGVPQDPLETVRGTTRNVDGTGGTCTLISSVDNDTMYYEYKSDGVNYELRTKLESLDSCITVKNDGKADGYFEIGTNPGMGW